MKIDKIIFSKAINSLVIPVLPVIGVYFFVRFFENYEVTFKINKKIIKEEITKEENPKEEISKEENPKK
jgi:hypothetical protein